MSTRSHRRWNIEATLGLPILWSFTALLLAMIIPPPTLDYQLRSLYHHSPRSDLSAEGAGRTALILTAHPDDEAMFFSPTILGLRNHGWEVRGLCLSLGDAEGLGDVRKEELIKSYSVLGVEEKAVDVMNHTYLQDSMTSMWDTKDIQHVVTDYLAEKPVDVIITFDSHGVSQHPNHVSLSHYRPPSTTESQTMLYHLQTPSMLSKYTGPLNPVFRRGHYQFSKGISEWMDVFDFIPSVPSDFSVTSTGLDWIRSVRAMREHKSQMKWFRYGWLAASSMMWANDLVLVV